MNKPRPDWRIDPVIGAAATGDGTPLDSGSGLIAALKLKTGADNVDLATGDAWADVAEIRIQATIARAGGDPYVAAYHASRWATIARAGGDPFTSDLDSDAGRRERLDLQPTLDRLIAEGAPSVMTISVRGSTAQAVLILRPPTKITGGYSLLVEGHRRAVGTWPGFDNSVDCDVRIDTDPVSMHEAILG